MSVINSIPLIAAAGDDGYQISRSVRLRSSASAYFNRTPASAGNQQVFTLSLWLKRGALTGDHTFFCARQLSTSAPYFYLSFDNSNNILSLNANTCTLYTTAIYRDPSAWYHVVYAIDTTQATASNRIKLYVNGTQVTTFSTASYPSQNANTGVNSTIAHWIGAVTNGIGSLSQFFDGYLTEVNFIDGQALTPSSFGQNNPITGVWEPKQYTGTYGTNGFYLNFSDPTSTTTLTADQSGNGNNWTANNISLTSGATYDSMIDTPTPVADVRGNFCVMSPIDISSGTTINNGNLTTTNTGSTIRGVRGTIALPPVGKYYWEYGLAGTAQGSAGVASAATSMTSLSGTFILYAESGLRYVNSSTPASYGATYGVGDVIGVAYDADAGTIVYYKNNVSQGAISLTANTEYFPYVVNFNSTNNINFGQRLFAYTPPSGFKALHTGNLPEPAIVDGGEYFNTVLWTGNGTSQNITGVGFQPDCTWIKERSAADGTRVFDVIRGAQKALFTDSTEAEFNATTELTAFLSDGFSVGSGSAVNQSSQTYVAWNWKANGAGVTNTDGSITSTVSANPTAGFSIVTFTGNGSNPATVGHGLGVAPRFIIFKRRNASVNWFVYAGAAGNGGFEGLNTTAAYNNGLTIFNSTAPTSTVFSLGNTDGNASGGTYVAYCFAEVPGYSRFGSYTGNGSADGPFIFCGFRPAWVMIKRTDAGPSNWTIQDTSRDAYNAAQNVLYPNVANAEATSNVMDVLSNGFKLRTTSVENNGNGASYIYAAFAENPFKHALAR